MVMCGQMQLTVSCGPAILPRACKPAQSSVPGFRGLPFYRGMTFLPTSHPCVCCFGTPVQLVCEAAWDRSDDERPWFQGKASRMSPPKTTFLSFVNKSQPSRGGRSSLIPPREFLSWMLLHFTTCWVFFVFSLSTCWNFFLFCSLIPWIIQLMEF